MWLFRGGINNCELAKCHCVGVCVPGTLLVEASCHVPRPVAEATCCQEAQAARGRSHGKSSVPSALGWVSWSGEAPQPKCMLVGGKDCPAEPRFKFLLLLKLLSFEASCAA